MFRRTKLNQVFIASRPKQTDLGTCFDAEEVPRARLLVWYLVHSCIYYRFNTSVFNDYEFDALASALSDFAYDVDIQKHPHANCIDWQSLEKSSSGYYIEFPSVVVGCAEWLIKEQKLKQTSK